MTFSQVINDNASTKEIISLLANEKENLKISYSKYSIPKSVQHTLSKLNGCTFRISNSGRIYRKSDMVRIPFMPNKQLVFHSYLNNYGLVLYRQGGRGFQTHCIIYELETSKVVKIADCYVNNKIDNLDSLLLKLYQEDLRFNNVW